MRLQLNLKIAQLQYTHIPTKTLRYALSAIISQNHWQCLEVSIAVVNICEGVHRHMTCPCIIQKMASIPPTIVKALRR